MKPAFTPTTAEAAAIAETLDAMANTKGNGATMTPACHFPAGRGFPVLENCQRKGATMTASELIDLLKSHLKACRVLGLRITKIHGRTAAADKLMTAYVADDSDDVDVDAFRRWLLGAAQEWADENGIHTEFRSGIRDEYVASWGRQEEYQHLGNGQTRLHALLAAIEAVA